MGQAWYDVVIVQPEKWADYQAFHVHGSNKRSDNTDIDPADLAVTEMVQAKNKDHAVQLMRAKYPKCTIDADATSRHK